MVTQNQIDSLQNLVANDIIDRSEGEKKIHMLKNELIKSVHVRSINQRSDGRVITKVELNGKLIQKSASSYDELTDKLYDFYFGLHNSTLESLYPEWIEYRKNESSVKPKTIKENGFIWDAHLKGQAITRKPINQLLPKDYISFFRTVTKNREMTRKRFNDMKSVMNGILYFAIEKEIIIHNPLSDINYQQFCYKAESPGVFPYNELERHKIIKHLGNDNIYSLAIKLDFHLVLRIGELKGLRFDDITDRFICVQRFVNEKNVIEDDIKGHSSSGKRYLPLTADALHIINCIKDMNPNGEYLFIRDGQPLATCTFNRHLKKCCQDLDIPYRSSHKIRFSTSSIMYKNGVTAPELQEMLGHTTLTMTNHYLRNVTSRDETWEKANRILG